MKSAESPLEQTRRHVTEGEQRIARQETLIEELEQDGHANLLPAARELLAQLQSAQQLGREHLQREERKAGLG